MRVTHLMVEKGFTFDKQKIAAIEKERRQREVDEFIAQARKFWQSKGK